MVLGKSDVNEQISIVLPYMYLYILQKLILLKNVDVSSDVMKQKVTSLRT